MSILSNRKPSGEESSAEVDEEMNEVRLKIKAVEHRLKGGKSDPSADIHDVVPIYRNMSQDCLESTLQQLQAEKNMLLKMKLDFGNKGGAGTAGERPSTPGDADAVFCVVASNDTQQAVPRGTGFVISKTHVFTARHNCVDDDENLFSMVCLVKEIIRGEKLRRSAVIMLRHVVSNAADDWAVFERVGGEFACSVEICPEGRLPSAKEREAIGIKDFPAGLINTSSTAKLIVQSIYVKVCQYEKRLSDEESTGFMIQFEDDSEVAVQSSPTVEDVIMVAGGRVSGSCGAPYFNTAGEVVAFHVESIDDTEAQSSSRSSHVSYSHGYVLCRLPSFVEWYERSIGTIGLHDGAGV